jgi:aryl-alcohol dehydrogenase-like predicted oxidoreductase
MTTFDRRNFLKSSLFGASGMLVSSSVKANTARSDTAMITRTLGKTGIELPVLSMGVMRADTPNIVKAAYDSGLKLFDTAHGYQRGKNEEMLGEFFKDKPRSSFLIGTKVVPPGIDRKTGKLGPDFTREGFLEMAETSLKRLQMDHVDIFYHHLAQSRETLLNEDILAALKQLKEEGKAKHVGVSTHKNQAEVIRAAIEGGVHEVILVAINFTMKDNKDLMDAIEEGAAAGLGFIAMKTMAGGFHDEEKKIPVNGVAALKWVFQNPHIATSIPGFTKFDELQTDLEIMNGLEMTDEERENLLAAGGHTGFFCNGCSACQHQCRRDLPVSDLMRAYMYTYAYGNLEKARYVLDEFGVDADPCRGCPGCTVTCSSGFAVAERIAKVSRLKDVPEDFIT